MDFCKCKCFKDSCIGSRAFEIVAVQLEGHFMPRDVSAQGLIGLSSLLSSSRSCVGSRVDWLVGHFMARSCVGSRISGSMSVSVLFSFMKVEKEPKNANDRYQRFSLLSQLCKQVQNGAGTHFRDSTRQMHPIDRLQQVLLRQNDDE
jgi:hypothetical protein